jgi:hypothetical protein
VKTISLLTATDEELVDLFALSAERVGDAVVNWLPAVRLTKRLFAISDVLRARGKEPRLKLAALLDDRNRFVRYYTAQELIHLLPGRCRPIIVENTKEFDAIAGDARGFLRAYDEGTLPLY